MVLRYKLILVCCIVSLLGRAQTMTDVFSKIPGRQMALVDSVKRLDLMDLYKAGKHAEVKNNLGDICLLKSFSEDYLLLQIGSGTVEVILLPMINDSKVVCLVQTVCAPVCDSRIEFYTTEWKQLETDVFITPVPATWFFKDSVQASDLYFRDIQTILDMNLMQFNFDKETLTLKQTYLTPQYLDANSRKKVEAYLKSEPKVFHWKQTRFE